MLEAGDVITAEEAERRVLVLENPGAARQVAHHQFAVRRHAADHAGRDRRRAPARGVGHPLRARRRGRLHRGRGREDHHGAWRLHPHANWAPHDHGNPGKQPMIWLDVLDMPTVNYFETSFSEHFDEKMQNTEPRGRRLARALRLGRAAGRHVGRRHEAQPGHQLPLRRDAADPRAAEEDRRHRQAPRRARALRQPDQRRLGDCRPWARTSRCCRRVSRARTIARPTARSSSASKARARPRSTARPSNGAPNDVFVVPSWKRYSHTVKERGGAVLDLRPAGAGSARHLAREQLSAPSSRRCRQFGGFTLRCAASQSSVSRSDRRRQCPPKLI